MRIKLVESLGLIAAAAVWGCGAANEATAPIPVAESPKFSCMSNAATMRLPANLRATLPTFGPRHPDDDFVAIANSVPGGFAGVFVENNHAVVTFVNPVLANEARAVITEALVSRGFGSPNIDLAHAEFRGARWTFAELDEWYRYITPKAFTLTSGISTTDIDEKANTIAIGVIDEASRAQLEAQLASLHVSCNLVTTTIQSYAQLL